MKDEKVWDYSICNIGHPCKKCIEQCTFYKKGNLKMRLYENGWKCSKYMIEHPDEILNNNEFPCDNCDHLNCAYCNIEMEWKKLHSTTQEKFTWE